MDPESLYAVVQTFHVDQENMSALCTGVDQAIDGFADNPDFGGLLCLEQDGHRQLVTVIVMWRASALDAFRPEVERAHDQIAATSDFGVTTQTQRVVRFVAGATNVSAALGPT